MNLPRFLGTNCKHEAVIVVRSAGVERIVCENCGHISFSFEHNELVSAELASETNTD